MKKNDAAKLSRVISNNLFLAGIAMREAPLYTVLMILAETLHRVVVFIEHVYMIGYIINAITLKRPFTEVLLVVLVVFVSVVLVVNVRNAVFEHLVVPVSEQRINRRIRMELYRKAASMDLKCYDDPEFYDRFVWAMSEAPNRIKGVLNSISKLLGSLVGIAVSGAYILSQDSFGIIVIVLSFLGIMVTGNILNKLTMRLETERKPAQRRRDYISRVLYLADYTKELRLNRIKTKLDRDFGEASGTMEGIVKRHSVPIIIAEFISGFVFQVLMIDGVYLLHLLYQAIVMQLFPYGTMVILYNSCGQVRGSLFGLSTALPQFQEHSLYIDKIREFLDYKNTVVSPKEPAPLPRQVESLVFENVSFAYGDKTILKDINLTIRKGQKIAVVGTNGAGKTTLVKLLMRLYDVSAGRILLNGRDIRSYDLAQYRSVFESVFQDYQIFSATVAENIVCGTEPLDPDRAGEAVRMGGFAAKLASLPKGYDTQVTNEFDNEGVLFSGGEAQSLALSRALYKNSPVIILDEPSSALDPLAEYELNQTMYRLGMDKTVLTISHRLSTTKSADRIYLFDEGRIAEQGTHEELMAQNGRYAEMFTLQARKYQMIDTASGEEEEAIG